MVRVFSALSILIGTIIGAGFLGMPYVFMKSGFFPGLAILVVVWLAVVLTTLYLGEVIMRTKEPHQLIGYASLYLGKKGKKLMSFSLIFGIYSALVAYLMVQGESWSYILFGSAQYSLQLGILFWLAISLLSYVGLKALEESDSLGLAFIAIMVLSIFLITFRDVELSNLTYFNYGNIFVPFGVVLFSLLAYSILPEVVQELGSDRRKLKKVIWTAYIFAFFVYAIFTALVFGYKGLETPEIATLALGKPFALLGIITVFMAYFGLSISLMDTFRFDFKKTKPRAWLYTIIVPAVIFVLLKLFNIGGFTTILGVGGAVSGAFALILILKMAESAKKRGDREPEYSIPYNKIMFWIITALAVIGAVSEIYSLIF